MDESTILLGISGHLMTSNLQWSVRILDVISYRRSTLEFKCQSVNRCSCRHRTLATTFRHNISLVFRLLLERSVSVANPTHLKYRTPHRACTYPPRCSVTPSSSVHALRGPTNSLPCARQFAQHDINYLIYTLSPTILSIKSNPKWICMHCVLICKKKASLI